MAIKLIILHDPRATCVGWNDSYSVLSVLFICTLTVAKVLPTAPSIPKVFLYSPVVFITAESYFDNYIVIYLALSSQPRL